MRERSGCSSKEGIAGASDGAGRDIGGIDATGFRLGGAGGTDEIGEGTAGRIDGAPKGAGCDSVGGGGGGTADDLPGIIAGGGGGAAEGVGIGSGGAAEGRKPAGAEGSDGGTLGSGGIGAPAAGGGALRGRRASSAMCLSKIAVFSSSSSQSMSIELVELALLAGPLLLDVIGTVGVRPKEVAIGGLTEGTTGTGDDRLGSCPAEGSGNVAA